MSLPELLKPRTVEVIGRALASTNESMGDFGSIGLEVLKQAGIAEIDLQTWYPIRLRDDMHEAAHRRFGDAVLFYFGFCMTDYYPEILAGLDTQLAHYKMLMASSDPLEHEKAVGDYTALCASLYDRATKMSGRFVGQIKPYTVVCSARGKGQFEYLATGYLLPSHHAFSRGILEGMMYHCLAEDWHFSAEFSPDEFTFDGLYSVLPFRYQFERRTQWAGTSAQLSRQYKAEIKESLLKSVIKESNHSLGLINASVRYASRLQQALLPDLVEFKSHFLSAAVNWQPRDVIGGDFWWFKSGGEHREGRLALIDCTGHGVPGSMLTLVVNAALNRIHENTPDLNAAEVLQALDQELRKNLKQEQTTAVWGQDSDDGCDAGLVYFSSQRPWLAFAGAKINLIQKSLTGQMTLHAGSRISLGYRGPLNAAPSLQKIPFTNGDIFVLYTDGVTDQTGGESERPRSLGTKRLLEAVKRCESVDSESVSQSIWTAVSDWQGKGSQRDDRSWIVFQMP